MKKFRRNSALNNKTINVGSVFMRERVNYGFMSSNDYYICKVIEKKGATITFEQYNKKCEQIATRTAKIMTGKLLFKHECGWNEYSGICEVNEYRPFNVGEKYNEFVNNLNK